VDSAALNIFLVFLEIINNTFSGILNSIGENNFYERYFVIRVKPDGWEAFTKICMNEKEVDNFISNGKKDQSNCYRLAPLQFTVFLKSICQFWLIIYVFS